MARGPMARLRPAGVDLANGLKRAWVRAEGRARLIDRVSETLQAARWLSGCDDLRAFFDPSLHQPITCRSRNTLPHRAIDSASRQHHCVIRVGFEVLHSHFALAQNRPRLHRTAKT